MTKKLELYKCEICGNIVDIVLAGEGELVCCGQPMNLLEEQSMQDEMLQEKHVPVIKMEEGDERPARWRAFQY